MDFGLDITCYTLKELGSCIWWTSTERVQFAADCELVAETEVGKFDVLIPVHQQVFSLQKYIIIVIIDQ